MCAHVHPLMHQHLLVDLHLYLRIHPPPHYPQTPIAYGNRYAPSQSKVSKNNNFVESVVQTVVEPVVGRIGNAFVEKIKLLKSGIGKSGHHHRRPYFGRY